MERQPSNNLLESVFRADDDWRINNNCNSILELRSQDFFPRQISRMNEY